ncbi:MAG: alpha/beta hydrolase [Bacteroidota bacterium]|nr:alpha/beta hydrolase [Bacteroidota bacterium]
MRRFIVSACLLIVFAACQKPFTLPGSSSSVQTDLAYGSDTKQKLDIYLPAGRSTDSTRLLVLIHGGAWTTGDKADFSTNITALQQLLPNYAIANINYRLEANGQNTFPAQENDVKTALDFIYNHRKDYGISDKWVLLGASAGAHLAMLQGYKYSSPVKPAAIVSFFGPSELVALYNSNPLIGLSMVPLLNGTPASNPGSYQQSSPYNFITTQSPPTILLHGGADPLVPVTQSTVVRDKLQSLGVTTQYVFYPNNGHGWDGADLTDSYARIIAFLNANVH